MKELLKGQSLRFDIHDRGSGKPVVWGNGLHLHKTMNNDRYNGAEILVPLDNDYDIEFRNIRGKNKDIERRIRNEIYDSLVKYPQKRKELARTLFDQIERFSQGMSQSERIENLRLGADRIANSFQLRDYVREDIKKGIFNKVKQFLTTHKDEDGNIVYILQDVDGKSIKIGEDLILLENEDMKFNETY